MKQWEKEKLVVERTSTPITKTSLIKDFENISLKKGDTVIVHSSMSKLGWTLGGPNSVIEALIDVITREGTIAMPTMTTGNTDPRRWNYPSVPKEWWPIIRAERPAYQLEATPTRGMCRIPEVFRTYPEVCRSNHPIYSFTAWGKNAKNIIENHNYTDTFTGESPLGRFYQLNARILLIGVGHINNTSLHHAECKANIPNFPRVPQGAALLENGKRVWKDWEELEYSDEDFTEVGNAFEKSINYEPKLIEQTESCFSIYERIS